MATTTLNVNKQTVLGLLSSGQEIPFVIPEYQRPYSWGDDEITTLFDDLWNFVADGNIWNAEHLTGRYTRKIRFKCGIESYTVFEKRYNEVTLWHHFKEKKSASIKDLMDNLPADDMVEYLRERVIGLEIRG